MFGKQINHLTGIPLTAQSNKKRLAKRKNRYNLDSNHEFDWNNDHGEMENIIWEWWRASIFIETIQYTIRRHSL